MYFSSYWANVNICHEKKKQRRQIKDFIFNRRISRELRFIQLVKSVRNISNRIYKTASKFEKEIFKFGCPSSRSLEDAECIHLTMFCKESQRNEQRFLTHVHAFTNIVLVAVAVEVYSLSSLKLNNQQIKPSRTKRRLKVQKNISAMKHQLENQNI